MNTIHFRRTQQVAMQQNATLPPVSTNPTFPDYENGIKVGYKDFSSNPLFKKDVQGKVIVSMADVAMTPVWGGVASPGNEGSGHFAGYGNSKAGWGAYDSFALLAAAAEHDKSGSIISKMITDNGDKTYTVHFADGKDIRVDSWFCADDKNNLSFGPNVLGCLWPAILQKAYQVRKQQEELIPDSLVPQLFKAFGPQTIATLNNFNPVKAKKDIGKELVTMKFKNNTDDWLGKKHGAFHVIQCDTDAATGTVTSVKLYNPNTQEIRDLSLDQLNKDKAEGIMWEMRTTQLI